MPSEAIAAANALSDVYAMGGSVLMAINLVAWPDNLDYTILSEVLWLFTNECDSDKQAECVRECELRRRKRYCMPFHLSVFSVDVFIFSTITTTTKSLLRP